MQKLEEQPLLAGIDEEDGVKEFSYASPKELGWWLRPNRCAPRYRNGPCFLCTFCLSFLLLTIIMLPVTFFVIIPQAIRSIVENAPPVYINKIDLQRFFAVNESISLWFNAELPLRGPQATFRPNDYKVSLVAPANKQANLGGAAGLELGQMSLGSFSSDGEGVKLDFMSNLHSVNPQNMRTAFVLVGEHLKHVLGPASLTGDDTMEISAKRPGNDALYRLNIQGRTSVELLGMVFNNVFIRNDIALNVNTKSFLKRFQPVLEYCYVGGSNCTTAPGDDDDEEKKSLFTASMSPFTVNMSISILNPTVFGLNLGALTIPITVKNDAGAFVPLGTAFISSFNVPYTSRSTQDRDRVSLRATMDATFNGIFILKQWQQNKSATVAIDGKDILLGGYPDEPSVLVDQGRLRWLENILEALMLSLDVPPVVL